MKPLFWNYRGFNRNSTVRYLREVLWQHLPKIFYLVKTLVADLQRRILLLGYDNLFEVPPKGRKGGFIVAWKTGVVVEVQTFCECNC